MIVQHLDAVEEGADLNAKLLRQFEVCSLLLFG